MACLNPGSTSTDHATPHESDMAAWMNVGIPILGKALRSAPSPSHIHLLHGLHFLPSTSTAPLIQQVGMHDVQSACLLVVTHFRSTNSIQLLDHGCALIAMTAPDQRHQLSLSLVFHLRQNATAINHLLVTATLPMLWALHACCPQSRMQVLNTLPKHIDTNFASCSMLLLRAIDNHSLPRTLEPFLWHICLETLRRMDERVKDISGASVVTPLPPNQIAWKCRLWTTGKESFESLFLSSPPSLSHHLWNPSIEQVYCQLLSVMHHFAADSEQFVMESVSALSALLDALPSPMHDASKRSWTTLMRKSMLINGLTVLCPDRHHPMYKYAN